MRLVDVNKIDDRYFLARNIHLRGDPKPFLKKDDKLTWERIEALQKLQVQWIYIEDPLSLDVEVEDVIQEETRIMANALMADVLSTNPPKLNRENTLKIRKTADLLVGDVMGLRKQVTVELWNLKTMRDYLFLHTVNVTVLSIMVGWRMSLNHAEMMDLAMGVLLHDIGKVTIGERIHNKPGRLTYDEYEEMKKHTVRGFEFLKMHGFFSPTAWSVAHQHHEMYDGSGYPLGRKGKEIHRYSRIAAIADIFDALTSDRPYKKGWPFHKVLNYMTSEVKGKFDKKALETFVNLIPQYPPGSTVRLSTGEIGIILRGHNGNYHKPVVRIIADPYGNRLKVNECHDIDLSRESEIKIVS